MNKISRFVAPAILLACLIFVFVLTLSLSFQDRLYPQVVLLVLCALTVTLMFQKDGEGKPPDTDKEGAKMRAHRVWGAILLMVAYMIAWQWIGYWVATVVFVAVLTRMLGERNWILVTGMPVVVALLVYFIFFRILSIPLPAGELF
jgi:hypothetical protein